MLTAPPRTDKVRPAHPRTAALEDGTHHRAILTAR